MAAAIRIVEVGPRDGLQSVKDVVPLAFKIDYVNKLSETGIKEIEAGAFVRGDRIPQMADSEHVFEGIERNPAVKYSALVPNEAGLERALKAKVDKIAVFTAASETFNRKNINAGIVESIKRFEPVVAAAKKLKLPCRAYVSTAFVCPFEGPVSADKVIDVCDRLLFIGVEELSIGDTIGKATLEGIRALLPPLLKRAHQDSIFLHFHDTFGRAVDNALCAYKEFGITGFDSSAGGIGGCPYAPGASGNVATERLLEAFKAAGAKIPAQPEAVRAASEKLLSHLRRNPS